MSKPLSVRIPDELRDLLDHLAETERRSVSNVVTLLLENAIRARGDEPLRSAQNLPIEALKHVHELLPIVVEEAERRGMGKEKGVVELKRLMRSMNLDKRD